MSPVNAYQAVSGGASADALVARHAELVKRIAYHLAGRLPHSVEVDDLIQAGMIGLLEAAAHYASDRGASFETYAGIRIRGAMIDALRKQDWAPRSVHRKARAAAQAIRTSKNEAGREARDSEIAKAMGLSIEEYHRVLQDSLACQLASMDEANEAHEVADREADPLQEAESGALRLAVADAISRTAGAREAGHVDVLRRRAESEGNRRGAGHQRVARLPAAWPGAGAPARAAAQLERGAQE